MREDIFWGNGGKGLLRFGALGAVGFFSGVCNGLLGAGGGLVAVYGLSAIYRERDGFERDRYANALCIMLPLSSLSCIRYAIAGHLSADSFGLYALPAIAGGIFGALLLGRLSIRRLRGLFGALVIWSGILMIVR